MLGKRLSKLRGKSTQQEIADKLGISRARYSHYENDRVDPDRELLNKMADLFEVPVGYLTGHTDDPNASKTDKLPELTEKDERDIAKDLEKIIKNLESENGYAQFDGQTLEDMDEEDKELLIASLENSMRLAKRLAKQKFTPKKYKK